MNNPPNNEYRKPYLAGEVARTRDRIRITNGLPVFTNNLDIGVIDLSSAEWEWHGGEGCYHLWFDVRVHTNYMGDPASERVMQSDDRVSTRHGNNVATLPPEPKATACDRCGNTILSYGHYAECGSD